MPAFVASVVDVVQLQVFIGQLFAETVQALPLESVPAFVASVMDAVQMQGGGLRGIEQVAVTVQPP